MNERALLVLACCAWSAGHAYAEPVPIGRHVEIRVGVSSKHPYATSGGDARRTGRSRSHAPQTTPTRLWTVFLPQQRLLPPTVLSDGTLIVGSAAGVFALDPASGAQRWFAPLGVVHFTPSVTPAGELVLAASGKLMVVSSGGAAREVALPFSITGAPLVLGSGNVAVAGSDGQTHALALDGAELAGIPTPAADLQRWTALIGGDLLLTASGAAELHLSSLRSGDARTLRLPERVATSPVVGDDKTIWVLSERGTLYRITTDGQTRFSAVLGQGGPADGPALGWDGALRVGLRYGEIACFASDGQQRWRRGLDAAPGPMLIDADDNALFVSARGTLYVIDRQGELRWRQGLEVRGAGRPVLAADGTIYVVSRGGQIQAWR